MIVDVPAPILPFQVERSGIDAVVEIGDAWMAQVAEGDEGYAVPPEFRKDRFEALLVAAIDAHGGKKHLISRYKRKFGRIQFEGDTLDVTETSKMNNLQPILDAWKRMGFQKSEERDDTPHNPIPSAADGGRAAAEGAGGAPC